MRLFGLVVGAGFLLATGLIAAIAWLLFIPGPDINARLNTSLTTDQNVNLNTSSNTGLRSSLNTYLHSYLNDQAEQLAPVKISAPGEPDLLADGLLALKERDFGGTLETYRQMTPKSPARKALAWSIATSDTPDIPASLIAEFQGELAGWPLQSRIRANHERAFFKGEPDAAAIIAKYEQEKPDSTLATVTLARAYLETGDPDSATRLVRSWWPTARLSTKRQQKYLEEFTSLLRPSDHKQRMDRLLYNGKTALALKLSAPAQADSLAKGRAAVADGKSDAARTLGKVDESWNDDPGLLYSKILLARRKGNYDTAAKLLQGAPLEAERLIDPDKWWVERRIVSREMLERGKVSQAYEITAAHGAAGKAAIADAEFHAGWYALRFLEDPKPAGQHFSALEQIATTPITRSRALYWLGRTAEADQRADEAKTFFESAADYPGTFYGQLANERLGRAQLDLHSVSPTMSERKTLAAEPLFQAILAFEAIGEDRRAGFLYRQLARTLTDPAQLDLLAQRLQKRGNHPGVLTIGKLAFNRGILIEHLAFPLGAIPDNRAVSSSNLAMMYAIARQESGFRADAVSPAGALGLLQVMPKTAKAVARGLELAYSDTALVQDPGLNATIGATYFQEQLQRWNGSFVLTLAAYNAGPNRLKGWLERFGDPRGKSTDEIIDWIETIPFPETRNYVMRVMEAYTVYQRQISQSPLRLAEDLAAGS